MPSLARFLANIRPHFDQLRSDAHAVVCMDKSLFAITNNFGKAGSQFHKLRRSVKGHDGLGLYSYNVYGAQLRPLPNIPRIWRTWRIFKYTPIYQDSYIRPKFAQYTKCIMRSVYIRLLRDDMPTLNAPCSCASTDTVH